jgi:hypothetical protein
MGEYQRSTRECSLESLGDDLLRALDKLLEIYYLGPIAGVAYRFALK